MILEIDTHYIIKNQITAHQYIIAKLAYSKEIGHLKYYLDASHSFSDLTKDLKTLREADLLEPASSEYATFDIRVTEKFIKDHSFTNDPFEELYNTYPVKTIRPNGNIDYLRVDHKRSKKIYHNILRMNRLKHEYILTCLKLEIEDRELKGDMSFMKRLPSWLTSESWKEYADMASSHIATPGDKIKGYGTDIE